MMAMSNDFNSCVDHPYTADSTRLEQRLAWAQGLGSSSCPSFAHISILPCFHRGKMRPVLSNFKAAPGMGPEKLTSREVAQVHFSYPALMCTGETA